MSLCGLVLFWLGYVVVCLGSAVCVRTSWGADWWWRGFGVLEVNGRMSGLGIYSKNIYVVLG